MSPDGPGGGGGQPPKALDVEAGGPTPASEGLLRLDEEEDLHKPLRAMRWLETSTVDSVKVGARLKRWSEFNRMVHLCVWCVVLCCVVLC